MFLAALDPNWFYSTLAQSTAAIVGLAGGFLAQRLVAQRGDLGGERLDLRRNAAQSFRETYSQRPLLDAIVESMDTNLSIVRQARDDGHSDVTLQRDFVITFTHGPGYAHPGPLKVTVDAAERWLTETRDAAQALLDVYPRSATAFMDQISSQTHLDTRGYSWLRDPRGERPTDGIDFENVYRWLPFQRSFAQERFQEIDRQFAAYSRALSRLRSRLLPRSFFALLAILAGLLLVGLIAPLFFLSARDDASRPLLLVGFIPLSLAFLGFIAYELHRLRDAGNLKKDF